jgi:hypothetical protein
MKQSLRISIRIISLLLFGCSTLVGCRATSVPDTPTAPLDRGTATAPAVSSTVLPATIEPLAATLPTMRVGESTAGIQRTVDLYARAYNEHDDGLLKQVVDQSNAPFRRFMQTRFDQSSPTDARRSYTVRAILQQRPYGFVLARIESDGQISDVTFRQINDGQWVMSEPTEAQIGERTTIEREHFTFYTYPWLDDINPMIMDIMEQARANVLQRLGKVSDRKPLIHIKPIFGVGSPADPSTRAAYHRNDRLQDRIDIFAPQSYAFGFYDPVLGWETSLEQVLTHEYTHLVNDYLFVPLSRMSGWMREGVAEYIAEIVPTKAVHDVVRSGRIIPIIDPSNRIDKRDLQHFDALEEDSEITYGLAYALVAYIAERYGGLDGFWKLAAAYDKTQNLDTALQQAFGVPYTQFDQDWRVWLKATYR